jgi:hypothetical protein
MHNHSADNNQREQTAAPYLSFEGDQTAGFRCNATMLPIMREMFEGKPKAPGQRPRPTPVPFSGSTPSPDGKGETNP